ncbi:hypothetical protein SAMN05216251_101264 [Actinacidiphila alni]|uniref:Uncharacterized protein n=1 Tax=Actinacidiphila alni TaxID=380248 RepID=A0A1I1XEK5_9ACTN|nr:hypothetical protein [Actinacidiphila alni]SFE04163.1 hypothetical protein SAMN05216251_101264 [Actinacidiphila alni]
MRARTLAAVAAVLLVAGCGSATGVRVGAPDPSATSTRPVCGDLTVAPGGGADGREVCLSVGSTLKVTLAPGDQPPGEQGDALSEISPGVYRGARAGTAVLSGFRHACPGATPGAMSCHAIAGWKITVDVR